MTESRLKQATGSPIMVKYDFTGPVQLGPAALHMLSFEDRSPKSPGSMSVSKPSGAHSQPGVFGLNVWERLPHCSREAQSRTESMV